MESPRKSEYHDAADQDKHLQDTELPQEVYEDMKKHETFLYFAFMFLNGSVLWAYYSCLAAQDFYMEKFKKVNFAFLTVLVTAWPMVAGHAIQMVFNVEKRVSQHTRVIAGYIIFMAMGLTIMILSAIDFNGASTGGYLVLVCFGVIGFANSLSETTSYTLAALFPIEKFTNAVQIGNTCAGAANVTLQTIIRLAVGGVKQSDKSNSQSFYIFFSMLLVVCVLAMLLYKKVLSIKCMAYLIQRNAENNRDNNLDNMSVGETLSNYWRIFQQIWVPCLAQFLVFFVSLTVFPGFGISAIRIYFAVDPPYPVILGPDGKNISILPDASHWYISPGIIAGYSFGDLFGRIMCTAAVYKLFTMSLSLSITILRLGYIVLLLMGVHGTSLYVFSNPPSRGTMNVVLFYEIIMTFTVGLTNGILSTVTMGRAPRMVAVEDREAAGSIMVLFLFTGIASGATMGFLISDNHWFGL